MKLFSIRNLLAAATLVSLPASTMALAIPFDPGATIFVPSTTFAAEPVLGGTVINDDVTNNIIDPFAPVDSFFGLGVSLQNRVVRSDLDNTLIFGPRISTTFNNTGGNFLVDRMVLTGFGDFAVDAAYRTDGLGDRGPTTATRSADGNTMTFDYLFPLVGSNLFQNPQETSHFLSLKTEATDFRLDGRVSVFARWIDAPGETFRFDFANVAVPVIAPVPLPASWLMLLGALGLGGILKRRQT